MIVNPTQITYYILYVYIIYTCMLPSYTYIEFKESKYHTNPLLPSSFDRLFAKCTAISTTKKQL